MKKKIVFAISVLFLLSAANADVLDNLLLPYEKIVQTGKTTSGVEVSSKELLLLRLILSEEAAPALAQAEFVEYLRKLYSQVEFSKDGRHPVYSSSGSRKIVSDLAILLLLSKGSPDGLIEYSRITGSTVDVLGFIKSSAGEDVGLPKKVTAPILEYLVYSVVESMNKARTSYYIDGSMPGVDRNLLKYIADLRNQFPGSNLVNRLAVNYIFEYDSAFGAAERVNRQLYSDVPSKSVLLAEYFGNLDFEASEAENLVGILRQRLPNDVFLSFCAEVLASSDTESLPINLREQFESALSLGVGDR